MDLEFINEDGAFNVTSLELLDPPVDGYNFNATITVRNPTPFIVEIVNHPLFPKLRERERKKNNSSFVHLANTRDRAISSSISPWEAMISDTSISKLSDILFAG